MSEMVERVADRLQTLAFELFYDPWTDETSEKFARAAIEAMREPTLSMVHAGAWAGPFTIDRYMAMIVSALSQSHPSLPTPAATSADAANPPPVASAGTNSEVQS
jgi:hypothetical protein